MLDPYDLTIERDHPFKKKDRNPATGKVPPGCAVCGAGKLRRQHLGAPPSMNNGGSGMDRMAFQALKSAWQDAFLAELEACGLPRGLGAVMVEAQIGFPTRAERDEGNHRWMIEKALGDALVEGGWLESDSFFPVARYSFGGMTGVHSPGRSFTRLTLFPSEVAPGEPAQDALPVGP